MDENACVFTGLSRSLYHARASPQSHPSTITNYEMNDSKPDTLSMASTTSTEYHPRPSLSRTTSQGSVSEISTVGESENSANTLHEIGAPVQEITGDTTKDCLTLEKVADYLDTLSETDISDLMALLHDNVSALHTGLSARLLEQSERGWVKEGFNPHGSDAQKVKTLGVALGALKRRLGAAGARHVANLLETRVLRRMMAGVHAAAAEIRDMYGDAPDAAGLDASARARLVADVLRDTHWAAHPKMAAGNAVFSVNPKNQMLAIVRLGVLADYVIALKKACPHLQQQD